MRKHFDFYGYNTPTSGKYYCDGQAYTLGEDYRTPKRYREYLNVGFNIVLLQHENEYKGEKWESSGCKKSIDAAYKAGANRVIVSDKRIKDLCIEPILVGEGGRFKTEEELLAFIEDCVKNYRNHPAFYGLQLYDEPAFKYLKEYAHVYKAVKKVLPDVQLQCNLLNMILHDTIAPDPNNKKTMEEDYADYLRYFQEQSGIDYLMTDEYAFRRGTEISLWTIPTYQVLAKVCKERGVEMRLVMQSFSQEACVVNKKKPDEVEGGIAWRRITERDMYWQMNLAMGFGCKEFSFFTYFTKIMKAFNGRRAGCDGIDGAAMVNHDGTRTKLYYAAKKIIKEMKDFESVILNYEFDDAYFFFPDGKKKENYGWTEIAETPDVNKIPVKVSTAKNPVIVTELKNGKNSLYMVQNIGNSTEELLYRRRPTEMEIDLSGLNGEIKFYYRGKPVEKELVGGKLNLKTRCGEAIFIENIKA